MRLAVSSIAWEPAEDEGVARVLVDAGVDAVELAPTKLFAEAPVATDDEVAAVTDFWAARGIEVVAFQSMLFGDSRSTLFDSTERRAMLVERLTGFLHLAARVGAKRLVFGSPRNRVVPEGMDQGEAWAIAVDVFGLLGETAERLGVVLCIEPNPTAYGCNFVTTADEGAALVREVGRAGFGLHLDAAGMTLSGDDVGASVRRHGDLLRHFHASAPQLGLLEDEVVDHVAAADALREIAYGEVVSVEMRPGDSGGDAERVRTALDLAIRRYGDAVPMTEGAR